MKLEDVGHVLSGFLPLTSCMTWIRSERFTSLSHLKPFWNKVGHKRINQ